MALDRDIARYYGLGAERDRLRESGGRLEFVRTQELLSRYLPSPPAIVVDVGGGGGIHAVALAAVGYEVELLDPVALHVEQARAYARERRVRLPARVGDARRLPYADASVDAALLLGPLYHLIDRAARLTALAEARRVLRSGGVLAAAAISRFASTFDGLARGFLAGPRFKRIVERDVRDGQHRNPDLDRHPEWFTTAYFHHLDELRGELEDAGLRVGAIIAVEGRARFARSSTVGLTTPSGVTCSFARSAASRPSRPFVEPVRTCSRSDEHDPSALGPRSVRRDAGAAVEDLQASAATGSAAQPTRSRASRRAPGAVDRMWKRRTGATLLIGDQALHRHTTAESATASTPTRLALRARSTRPRGGASARDRRAD